MNSEFDSPVSPPPPPPAPSTPAFVPSPQRPSSSDKALTILCHLSALLGVGFLLPFIVWLVKKDENDGVAAHAKEALNFHITLFIYAVVCVPLIFVAVGIPLMFALGIGGVVLAIIAAVRASDGGFYRYPLTLRLIS